MTNLTEQWKKGELPEGRYYIELAYNGNNIVMAEYWWDKALTLDDHEYSREEVRRILAPVPSYTEWDKLNNACHELEKETACLTVDNVNLKELLKECREILDYAKDFAYHNPCSKCITKINKVLGEE